MRIIVINKIHPNTADVPTSVLTVIMIGLGNTVQFVKILLCGMNVCRLHCQESDISPNRPVFGYKVFLNISLKTRQVKVRYFIQYSFSCHLSSSVTKHFTTFKKFRSPKAVFGYKLHKNMLLFLAGVQGRTPARNLKPTWRVTMLPQTS